MKTYLSNLNKNNLINIGVIFICSIFCSFFLFHKGISKGDDSYYHLTMIYDLYKSGLNNNLFYPLNEYMLSSIGYGARLYYPPLFDYTVVILALIFNGVGLGIIGAIKIVIFLEYFLSGVFMYYFLIKVLKNNKYLALFGAIIFVAIPYRTGNNFDRCAYAEALALTFIPLVFSSLYSMLNKEYTFKSFITFSISFAALFLSHTISALYTVLFGIIFALFFIRDFLSNLRNRRYRIYLAVSICLLIGLISFYFVPLLNFTLSKEYIATKQEYMGGTIEYLIEKSYLIKYKIGLRVYENVVNYGLLFILLEFIIQFVCFKFNKSWISLIISGAINIYLLIYYDFNPIFLSGVLIYYFVYFIFNNIFIDKEIGQNKVLFASITLTILSVLLLICPYVYKTLPSIFLNIQFIFRMYEFVFFFISILIPVLIYKIGSKNLTYICSILLIFVGFTRCGSSNYKYIYEVNDTILDNNTNGVGGWQREYLPLEFGNGYIPENSNSLFYKVRSVFSIEEDAQNTVIEPIIYNGKGAIKKIDNTYNLVLTSDSTIQFGKVYYEGYVIKVIDENNNTYFVDATKLDGLVSVALDKGTYNIELIYKGTTLNNASKIVSIVSASLVCVYGVYALVYNIKKGYKE